MLLKFVSMASVHFHGSYAPLTLLKNVILVSILDFNLLLAAYLFFFKLPSASNNSFLNSFPGCVSICYLNSFFLKHNFCINLNAHPLLEWNPIFHLHLVLGETFHLLVKHRTDGV